MLCILVGRVWCHLTRVFGQTGHPQWHLQCTELHLLGLQWNSVLHLTSSSCRFPGLLSTGCMCAESHFACQAAEELLNKMLLDLYNSQAVWAGQIHIMNGVVMNASDVSTLQNGNYVLATVCVHKELWPNLDPWNMHRHSLDFHLVWDQNMDEIKKDGWMSKHILVYWDSGKWSWITQVSRCTFLGSYGRPCKGECKATKIVPIW